MKGKDGKVTCDACGHNLTTTGNWIDYRLALMNEPKPTQDGVALTEVHIAPIIERDYHFCGVPCLAKWVTKIPNLLEEFDKLQKHRSWLAAGGPYKHSEEYQVWLKGWNERRSDETRP